MKMASPARENSLQTDENNSFPTLILCSDILDQAILNLKKLSNEISSLHKIPLEDNLLFIDINKGLLRAQSFLLFLTQGRQIKRTEKEEIQLSSLTSPNGNIENTQRQFEELYSQQKNEHQAVLNEYKKQLHQLKRILKKSGEKNYRMEESAFKQETQNYYSPVKTKEFYNIERMKGNSYEKKRPLIASGKKPYELKKQLQNEIEDLDEEIAVITKQINNFL